MAAYSSSGSNPFLTEDDDFQGSKGSTPYAVDKRKQLFEEVDASEDRQLESTRRILGSLYESERMGIDTAEELLKQGEQLDNIEKKSEEIDKNLTTSQRHLNSVKSVFGGIKNWWTAKKENPQVNKADSGTTRLQKTIDSQNKELKSREHPVLKVKADDCRGFSDFDEEDLDSKFLGGSRSQNQGYGQSSSQQIFKPVTCSKREEEVNENLGLMSDGMARLKDLALGLGETIEQQNDQMDRIAPNLDKVNLKIDNQNKQMRRVLNK